MSFTKAFDSVFKVINSTFGTSATYTHVEDGTTDSIKGVFDNAYLEVSTSHAGLSTNMKPVFRNVRLADLTAPPTEDDTLTIDGTTYTVTDHQDDAYGCTTLILEKN